MNSSKLFLSFSFILSAAFCGYFWQRVFLLIEEFRVFGFCGQTQKSNYYVKFTASTSSLYLITRNIIVSDPNTT